MNTVLACRIVKFNKLWWILVGIIVAFNNTGFTWSLTQRLGQPSSGIEICGDIMSDTTWTAEDSPYVITCNVTINEDVKLTLETGVIVKFQPSGGLTVDGRLVSKGTAAGPVVFTSIKDDSYGGDTNNDGSASTPAPGDWQGITIRRSSVKLSHIVIAYSALGLYLPISSADLDITLENNLFQNNKSAPVWLALVSDSTNGSGQLTVSDNTASGNGVNGVFIHGEIGGILALNWDGKQNFPVVIDHTLQIGQGGTLILPPGLIVKVMNSSGIAGGLTVRGRLLAQGTPDQPVTFTSIKDDSHGGDTNNDGQSTTPAPGDWGVINFMPESQGSILQGCIVTYGYRNFRVLTDDLIVVGSTMQNSQDAGIYIEDNVEPTLISNIFTDNVNYALYNAGSNSTIDVSNSWWGDSSGPNHAVLNPGGKGNRVSDRVNFKPWGTSLSSVISEAAIIDVNKLQPDKEHDKVKAKKAFDEAMILLDAYEERTSYIPASDQRDRIQLLLSRALELNPDYAEVYFYKGYLGAIEINFFKEEAILADLDKAIALKPNYAEALFLRFRYFDAVRLTDNAWIDLNKTLEAKPDHLPALINRANLYMQKEQWDKALIDLLKIVELIPGHTMLKPTDRLYNDFSPRYRLSDMDVYKVYVHYAQVLSHLEKWNEAVQAYAQAIEKAGALKAKPATSASSAEALEVPLAELYFRRGEVYEQLGNVEETVADYIKAIELNQDYLVKLETNLLRLNDLLSKSEGSKELQIKLARLIGKVDQDNKEAGSPVAAAMEEYKAGLIFLHKFEGINGSALMNYTWDTMAAGQHFSQAIAFDPKFAAAYLQRSRANEGDLADINMAIELNPNYADAYVDRAQWLLWDSDNKYSNMQIRPATPDEEEQAMADIAEALELNPDSSYALVTRAMFYAGKGRLDEALVDLNKAVEMLPEGTPLLEINAYLWRGKVFLAKGMYSETIDDLTKAMEFANVYNHDLLMEIKSQLYQPLHGALDKLAQGTEIRKQFEELVAKADEEFVIDWGPSK